MPNQPETLATLHHVLGRISSLFRTQMRATATQHDLKLVQLEALVYLAVANRYSDTTGAVGEYLGVTKGTVSQTLRALEQRGLLTKVADAADGRVSHCHLTSAGRAIADAAHPAAFLSGGNAVEDEETLAAALRVLRTLQRGPAFRTFGRCDTCKHYDDAPSGTRCGLTGEALSAEDSGKICREHAAPQALNR